MNLKTLAKVVAGSAAAYVIAVATASAASRPSGYAPYPDRPRRQTQRTPAAEATAAGNAAGDTGDTIYDPGYVSRLVHAPTTDDPGYLPQERSYIGSGGRSGRPLYVGDQVFVEDLGPGFIYGAEGDRVRLLLTANPSMKWGFRTLADL